LQGGIKERDRQQELNDQKYGDDIRNRNDSLNNAQNILEIEERRLGKRESSQNRKLTLLDRQIQDVKSGLSKLDERSQKRIESATNRYFQANTPGEKEQAGRDLQALLGKGSPYAPTDDLIARDVQRLESENIAKASAAWEKVLDNELKQFGQISDARFKVLEDQRISLANGYGLEVGMLRKTPTERTLKEEQMKLAEDKFEFAKGAKRQELKLKWANLQVAKQRAATYAQAVANGYNLGFGNLQQRQFSNDLARIRVAAKEYGISAAGELKTLQKAVKDAATDAASNPTDANNGKLAEARGRLNQFIQDTAGELGISDGDFLKDPYGSVKRMFSDEGEIEVPSVPGLPQYDPEAGDKLHRAINSTKPFQVNPPKPKPKTKPKMSNPVDEARKRGFIIG
jgi:hypothetical protein